MKKVTISLLMAGIPLLVDGCYAGDRDSADEELATYLAIQFGSPNLCLSDPDGFVATTEGATEGPYTDQMCFRLQTTGPRTLSVLPNPSGASPLMYAWVPLRLRIDFKTNELSLPAGVDDLWVWARCLDCTSYSVNF